MKIQVIEASSKRPLANTKVQLQVKGKDSGFLTLSTDSSGFITLEDKFDGQQIAATSSGGQQGQWMTASEGARLVIAGVGAGASASGKQTTTESQGGNRTK